MAAIVWEQITNIMGPRGYPGLNALGAAENDTTFGGYIRTGAATPSALASYTGAVSLTVNDAGVTTGNWTAKFQALIDDVTVECITIDAPISISTVSIPPNRRIRITSRVARNITGVALVTILPGGEGIRLNGAGTAMVNGVFIDGLSFTSNDLDVVGAITGQDVTGLFLNNLTFRNIAGSAVSVKGRWYDSACENLVMMDCGRLGFPIVVMGDTTSAVSDPNRVTWTNLRIERGKSAQLQLNADSYGNDFIGCKFHGPVTNATSLISLGVRSRDNSFVGGQISTFNSEGTGIRLDGYRNKLIGVMFTRGAGAAGDNARAVSASGFQNIVEDCSFADVPRPASFSGELNALNNCAIFGAGIVDSTGAFTKIKGNQFLTSKPLTGVVQLVDVRAPYANISDNTFQGWGAAQTYAIFTNASSAGSIIKNNIIFAGGLVVSAIQIAAANMIVKDNIAHNVTGSVVAQTGTDATRDVAGNKLVAA